MSVSQHVSLNDHPNGWYSDLVPVCIIVELHSTCNPFVHVDIAVRPMIGSTLPTPSETEAPLPHSERKASFEMEKLRSSLRNPGMVKLIS